MFRIWLTPTKPTSAEPHQPPLSTANLVDGSCQPDFIIKIKDDFNSAIRGVFLFWKNSDYLTNHQSLYATEHSQQISDPSLSLSTTGHSPQPPQVATHLSSHPTALIETAYMVQQQFVPSSKTGQAVRWMPIPLLFFLRFYIYNFFLD